MVMMRTEEETQEALRGLYDELLCHDLKFMDGLKEDALKARDGLPTGIILKSKSATGDVSDMEVIVPKHAITIIGARTGGGKTTTMVNLATRLALRGNVGMYVTLEEPAYAITSKMLSCFSVHRNPNHSTNWIDHNRAKGIVGGVEEHGCMDDFIKGIIRRCRVVDANKSVNLEHVESPTVLYYPQYIANLIKYRNSKSDKPLDFVLIDFGQLLESMDGAISSFERIRSVMQALKNLAGSLGIAVIIGAQMKRECYGLKIWDWEPELIRDGSDMEQAASLIIAIGKDKDAPDEEYSMAMRYLKNRNGPVRVAGMFNINFANCYIADRGLEPGDGS